MDVERIRQQLAAETRLGASELYSVIATFKAVREHKSGTEKSIIIEVLDMGADVPERLRAYRFRVHAFDEDGRYATGNGGETIDIAISTVHWGDLDGDPRPQYAKQAWKAMF